MIFQLLKSHNLQQQQQKEIQRITNTDTNTTNCTIITGLLNQ